MEVRLLNEQERKALKPIEKAHSITFEGGSCVREEGRETFYVGFYGIMATYGKVLAQKVKDALKAEHLILSGPGYQEVLD